MVHGLRSGKLMVQRISDEALLADIARVCREQGSTTNDTYRVHGKYSAGAVTDRFGKWKNALKRAGVRTDRDNHSPHDTESDDEADFIPLTKPKDRKCLGCGVAIHSINYTCGNCLKGNASLVFADGWEVVGA